MATKKNDSKLFARNKASELEEELKKALGYKDKNLYAIKEVLKKIVANVTMNNNEMVALSGYIITQCLTKADLEVKKMCIRKTRKLSAYADR